MIVYVKITTDFIFINNFIYRAVEKSPTMAMKCMNFVFKEPLPI